MIVIQKLCLIILIANDNYCGSTPQRICDSFFPPEEVRQFSDFFQQV